MYIHNKSLYKRKIGRRAEKERALGAPESDETFEQIILEN
jgi:hypothetical protein